jgi:hypothetical protein
MPGTTAAQCTCAQDTLAQLPFAQERKRFLSRLYCQLVDARSQAVNHDEMGFEWKQIYLVLLRRRFRVVPPSFACDFVIQNHKSSSRRRLLQIHYNSYTTTTRGFCILMLQQLDLVARAALDKSLCSNRRGHPFPSTAKTFIKEPLILLLPERCFIGCKKPEAFLRPG